MANPILRADDRRGVILNLRSMKEVTDEIREAVNPAIARATDILHAEIVEKTPIDTGETKKHIHKKLIEKNMEGRVYSKSDSGDQGIVGFIIRGTAEREQKKTGRKTGRMIANNYWRTAAEEKREEMMKQFEGLL